MAAGDFTLLASQGAMSGRGARLYNVAAGTPILAGEPVQHAAVGAVAVQPCHTSVPVVGTSGVEGLFVGIAATNSTNTTTVAGSVNVIPVDPNQTWLATPAVAASWDTQSEYDALVGKRVLIQNGAELLTYAANVNAGTYSILASDSAANGVVVMAMNVKDNPGKVAVAFRGRVSDLA